MLTHMNCHQQHWPASMCLTAAVECCWWLLSSPSLSVDCCYLNSIFILLLWSLHCFCCHHPLRCAAASKTTVPDCYHWCHHCHRLIVCLNSQFPTVVVAVTYKFVSADVAVSPVLLPLQAVPAFAAPCAAVLLMPLLFLLAVKFDIVSGHQLIVASFKIDGEYATAVGVPPANAPLLAFAAFVVPRSLYHRSWGASLQLPFKILVESVAAGWLSTFRLFFFTAPVVAVLPSCCCCIAIFTFFSCCPLILPAPLLFPLAVATSRMFLFFLKKLAIAVAVAGAAAAVAADNLLLWLRCSVSTIAACWHSQNGRWHQLIVASCKFDVAVTVDVLVTVVRCRLTCHLTCCFAMADANNAAKKLLSSTTHLALTMQRCFGSAG